MDARAVTRMATLLGDARLSARAVPDISPADGPETIAEGYAVQAALHRYLCDRTGGGLVGWKVGATTTDMQKYLGVAGPAYGRILSTNVHEDGVTLDAAGFCNPGIECEIAVHLASDAEDKAYTRDNIGQIVDAVLPAIEVVENRYDDFLARGTPMLIADDFFHKACVLGKPAEDWRRIDLAAVQGRTLIDGNEEGSGVGADVMGDPFEAVAWLANTLAGHGERLLAGQIVLTGSVAPVIWISGSSPTKDVRIDLGELGSVGLAID